MRMLLYNLYAFLTQQLFIFIIDAAVRRGASVQGETGPNPPGRIVGIGFVELIEFRLLPRHKYLICLLYTSRCV